MKTSKFIITIAAVSTPVLFACGGQGGGLGGSSSSSSSADTSAISSSSSSPSSGASSSGAGGDCLPLGCGAGWGSKCGSTTDSCGSVAQCACQNAMVCVHGDLCCESPAVYGYEAQAEARCAQMPGAMKPFVCGAAYSLDPDALDAGMKKPWLNGEGKAVNPSAEPPPYCVEAPYVNDSLGWILWCCNA